MTLTLVTITPTIFRTDFPEFTDATKYLDSQITYWIDIAYAMLPSARWKNILGLGVELFVAHNIVLEALAMAEGASGGIPGLTTGVVSSTGAGPVSVSYDNNVGLNPLDAAWNLTIYGRRFAMLMRDFGAGALVIGGYSPTPGGVVEL